jgi:hypothetical protein
MGPGEYLPDSTEGITRVENLQNHYPLPDDKTGLAKSVVLTKRENDPKRLKAFVALSEAARLTLLSRLPRCHRYKYKKKPTVIDLGLRLEDVESLGLIGEPVLYDSKKDPRLNLRRSGASEAECKFLVSGGRPQRWEGRRVELNELTSPQFITFVETKLIAAGVQKVVPNDEALAAAYCLQVKRAKLQQIIDEALKGIDVKDVKVPPDLGKKLAERIKGTPIPWDKALWEIVNEKKAPPDARKETEKK